MHIIIPDILLLPQYKIIQNEKPLEIRPQYCYNCGKKGLHRHATYPRQSDRENKGVQSLNPIIIQRYICPYCRKTCSVLPECIPPKRWYPWYIQQAILLACILGKSLNQIAKQHVPSRSTCKRWWDWLKERSTTFMHELKSLYPNLFGRCQNFKNFWIVCINKLSLSKAMLVCHEKGVYIP